jgi:uracil-DNA glycosylase
MSEMSLTPEQLRRQAAQHLEALRLAGVEWLPRAPLTPLSPPERGVGREGLAAPSPLQAESPAEAEPAFLFADSPKPPATQMPQENLTLEQRRTDLQLLAKTVSTCARCAELASTRTQTVFADGNIPSELCFIGEAPGADEDAEGKPFVGKAGQLLNNIITGCGLKREEVYICNIIKCRPPGNRTPNPQEAANCREYLLRQLELVQPKFICCLGSCAAQNLLGTTESVGKLRGRFHDFRGISVVCTYHPAYLLPHRSPGKKTEVWEDMKMLLKRMGRPIPRKANPKS